jgi:ELWxxDGT repeat protein
MGDTLFFCADNGVDGEELWQTDGSLAGTTMVLDINPGGSALDCSFQRPAVANDLLFFRADDGTHGVELWTSDGSAAGTSMVIDIAVGADSGLDQFGDPLAALDGFVYFAASDDNVFSRRVWKSDGTVSGTSVLSADGVTTFGLRPVIAGGSVFFDASDSAHGDELWRSDGTVAGTVLVKDFLPGSDGPLPSDKTVAGGQLFEVAEDDLHGIELWRSDGTSDGTTLVSDLLPGPGWSEPAVLGDLGGLLLFSADDGAIGREPWLTDGSEAGTVLLQDIHAGHPSSDPSGPLVAAGGIYFFAAADGQAGEELWAIQPTCPSLLDLGGRRVIADVQLEAPGEVVVGDFTATNGAQVEIVAGSAVTLADGATIDSSVALSITIDSSADCL